MYYWYAAVCAADSRSGPSIARTGAGWSRSRFRLTRVLSLVEAPKTLEMSTFFVQRALTFRTRQTAKSRGEWNSSRRRRETPRSWLVGRTNVARREERGCRTRTFRGVHVRRAHVIAVVNLCCLSMAHCGRSLKA